MRKICYLILAYNDPKHLKRMIERLDDSADFLIHIDKKTDITPFIDLLAGNGNVSFIEQRVNIFWGGYSIIQAELNLVREALTKGENYLRYVLLSGSDYPIKKTSEIYGFFEKNADVEYIRAINLDKLEDKKLFGIHIDRMQKHDYPGIKKTNTYWFNRLRAGMNFILRLFPMPKKYRHHKFDIYHGSQWWALTGPCLKDLMAKYDANPQDYENFKIGFASDEKFFHTLFFNSRFASKNQVKGPDNPITMKDRHKGDTSKQTSLLANIHIIDETMTKWFTIEDFDRVKMSDKLFVRKVSTQHSGTLLDKIDQEILFPADKHLKEGIL